MFIFMVFKIWRADFLKQIFLERRLKKNGDVTFKVNFCEFGEILKYTYFV